MRWRPALIWVVGLSVIVGDGRAAVGVVSPQPAEDESASCRTAVAGAIIGVMTGEPGARARFLEPELSARQGFEDVLSVLAAAKRFQDAFDAVLTPAQAAESREETERRLAGLRRAIGGARVAIKGDSATVSYDWPDPNDPQQIAGVIQRLERHEGRWLVDPVAAFKIDGSKERHEQAQDLAWAYDRVAQDIRSGTLKPPFSPDGQIQARLLERAGARAVREAATGKPAPSKARDEPSSPPADKEIRTWKSSGCVRGLALIGDASSFVTGSSGTSESVCLWDLMQDKPVRAFVEAGVEFHAFAVAVSSDGGKIFAGGRAFDSRAAAAVPGRREAGYAELAPVDCDVRVWDARTGALVRRLGGHRDLVTCLALSSDGRWLASGSADGTVRVWETATGAPVRTLEAASPAFSVRGVRFAQDGGTLVVGVWKDKGSLLLYRTADWAQARSIDIDRGSGRVGVSSNGAVIAGVRLGAVMLYSPEGEPRGVLKALSGQGLVARVDAVSFSPDGRYALCAEGIEVEQGKKSTAAVLMLDETPRVQVFDVRTQQEVAVIRGHTNAVLQAEFLPDMKTMLTVSMDGTIRRWAVPEGIASTRPEP